MRSVKVRGMVRGATGYAYHTRSFVRGFLALGTDVELEEYHLWGPQLPEHLQDPLYDRLSTPVDSTVQVQFAMPHRAVVTPGLATAVYTMFEATRIPPGWVPLSERWALTVVPSRSSVDAWTASGVAAERLLVCPLGVRPGLDRPDVRPLPLSVGDGTGRAVADYRHRFLNVAEVCTRKNHVGIMEAWLRATTPADDAVLVLKVNDFRPGAWDLLQHDVAAVCRRLGTSPADAAPVVTLTEYLPDEAMPRLYRTATHYLSLSRGEGWDNPMIEAAAAGLGLVAPRHSAYLDYLDDKCAHLVPSAEVDVDKESTRLAAVDLTVFTGLRWWEPDVEAAAATLRAIIDGRAPTTTSPGRRILADYAWETVSRRLLEILSELE